MSKIQWTERTWNPIVGCSIVSPGCRDCYAMPIAHKLSKNPQTPQYQSLTEVVKGKPVWTGKVNLVEHKLDEPLRRTIPTTWFVNSMGDLFHEAIPKEWIDRVFEVMLSSPQHRFQVLTKRAERLQHYLTTVIELPNVWWGISAEDQKRWDERVPWLRRAEQAAVRFVSYEPALGPIMARGYELQDLDWIIIGGESGPTARPFDLEWARSMRKQCLANEVACFVKQLGSRPYNETGTGQVFSDKKGGDPSEWPADLQVREMPA